MVNSRVGYPNGQIFKTIVRTVVKEELVVAKSAIVEEVDVKLESFKQDVDTKLESLKTDFSEKLDETFRKYRDETLTKLDVAIGKLKGTHEEQAVY